MCAGVDHFPGAIVIRCTPTVYVPAAEPRSRQTASRWPAAAWTPSTSSQCAIPLTRVDTTTGSRPWPQRERCHLAGGRRRHVDGDVEVEHVEPDVHGHRPARRGDR